MKKFFRIFLILVLIALFVGTLYYLYKKSQKKPIVFQTESPIVTTIVKKTVATGSVVPRKEIEIKPQVSGIIDKIYVEAGDTVMEGNVIAKVKIIPDMINLNNAESRVNRARLNLDNIKIEYDRQKKLFEKEVISETEFLQIKLQYNNAKEELETAENNLQLIKEGIMKKSATASNTLIRSTISGMVLDVPIEIGNSVIEANTFNAGTTIASVADMNEMIFKGKVDESEVGKIKEGMPLILTVGAIENERFNAILEYIAPKGVDENGAIQFEIRADVELKENSFIRAGYSANADIVLEKKDSVMAIPEKLLQFDKGQTFIEVETAPQTFERREIKTGLSDGLNIEILEGVTMEDKIKIPLINTPPPMGRH